MWICKRSITEVLLKYMASHMLDPTQVTYFSLGGASSLSDRSCDVSLQAFISSHCMHCRTNTASMLWFLGPNFKALAELLHDAQTVDLRGTSLICFEFSVEFWPTWASCRAVFRRGCPQLSEETLRSFRKGCRFIRWDLLGFVKTFHHRGDQRRHVQVTHVYVARAQGAALLLTSRRLCFSNFFKKQSTAFLVNLVRSVSVTMRDCHCTSSHALFSAAVFCGCCGVPFCFSIASQERTLTWTALTSSVKKHRHRRRSNFTSASRKNGTALDSMEQHGVTLSDMETHGNWLEDATMNWAPRAARAPRAIDLGGEKAGAEQRQGSKMFQAYAPLVLAASVLKLKSVWRLHSCKHFFEFVQPYSSGSALDVGWVWLS